MHLVIPWAFKMTNGIEKKVHSWMPTLNFHSVLSTVCSMEMYKGLEFHKQNYIFTFNTSQSFWKTTSSSNKVTKEQGCSWHPWASLTWFQSNLFKFPTTPPKWCHIPHHNNNHLCQIPALTPWCTQGGMPWGGGMLNSLFDWYITVQPCMQITASHWTFVQ